MTNLYIGIDVGGTNIKGGLVDADGRLVVSTSIPTAQRQGDILTQICELAVKLATCQDDHRGRLRSIGVAVPGTVDAADGIAIAATNLPWSNMPVARVLRERMGLPIKLENDTDAGAAGELSFGKARGVSDAVYVSVGTGVGGGLILGGHIHRGAGGAGEIGHMIALSDGPMCKCGTRGCLEAIASGPAIVGAASHLSGKSFADTGEVFAAAQFGDAGAMAAIGLAGKALASVFISVSRLLAPELIILGGGVSKAGKPLIEAITAGYREFAACWFPAPVVLSEMADWAGVLGAAASSIELADDYESGG